MVWQLIGPKSVNVEALAIDPSSPDIIYAGTFADGVLKSTNGGKSWYRSNTGMNKFTGEPPTVFGIVIDPLLPATLYAGTNSGVFRSTDNGGNWSAVNNGLTEIDILALAIDPSAPHILYAGTWGGVFKTTNGGGEWKEINKGLTNHYVYELAVDPSNPTTLYAGTHGGLFKSTDGGGEWRMPNVGLQDLAISALAIDPIAPATLYMGTIGGVLKSRDGGESWDAATMAVSPTGLSSPLTNISALAPFLRECNAKGFFPASTAGKNGPQRGPILRIRLCIPWRSIRKPPPRFILGQPTRTAIIEAKTGAKRGAWWIREFPRNGSSRC
jgi:ligand-binding sensor domain-containing protein